MGVVAVKKLYSKTQLFILSHFKLTVSIMVSAVFIGFATVAYLDKHSKITILSAMICAFPFATLCRLFTYSVGYIPIVMYDTLWLSCSSKYSKEEAEEKYKEKSLRTATVCCMCTMISYILWMLLRVPFLLLNLAFTL